LLQGPRPFPCSISLTLQALGSQLGFWHLLTSSLGPQLADVDEAVAEFFLMEESPPADVLREGIRRATLDLAFVPVRSVTAHCACHCSIADYGLVRVSPSSTPQAVDPHLATTVPSIICTIHAPPKYLMPRQLLDPPAACRHQSEPELRTGLKLRSMKKLDW